MTRKRFWKLRNALIVGLNKWAKDHGIGDKVTPGAAFRKNRAVPGKTLVNFDGLEEKSYKDVWESEAMKHARNMAGM